jgi:hypothetical protein
MGYGVSVGWVASVVAVGALSVAACGGNSENAGNDGSADDSFGGSSGSSSGGASNGGMTPNGGTSSGGSVSTGGISQGGSSAVGGTGGGAGGIIAVGGTGTGGSTSCPDCPEADYGLVIDGDGPTYEMIFNGWIDAAAADRISLPCAETPLRGSVGGCVRTFSFSACADPMSGPPCLEVGGAAVRYVSRRTGELFEGRMTSDVPATSVPGVTAGTFTVELTNAAGEALVLTVSYTFCAPFGTLLVVC